MCHEKFQYFLLKPKKYESVNNQLVLFLPKFTRIDYYISCFEENESFFHEKNLKPAIVFPQKRNMDIIVFDEHKTKNYFYTHKKEIAVYRKTLNFINVYLNKFINTIETNFSYIKFMIPFGKQYFTNKKTVKIRGDT